MRKGEIDQGHVDASLLQLGEQPGGVVSRGTWHFVLGSQYSVRSRVFRVPGDRHLAVGTRYGRTTLSIALSGAGTWHDEPVP